MCEINFNNKMAWYMDNKGRISKIISRISKIEKRRVDRERNYFGFVEDNVANVVSAYPFRISF